MSTPFPEIDPVQNPSSATWKRADGMRPDLEILSLQKSEGNT